MVFISSLDSPEAVSKGQPKMSTKQLILLTPEFFTHNRSTNAQFEDISAGNREAVFPRSPFLVPPTPEGLSLASNTKSKPASLLTPDSLAVIPFSHSVDHSSKQLVPFKQSLAPHENIPKHSSYLSICQSQVPLGIFWDVENVRLPKNKSPAAVIEAIRQKFLVHYREAEFLVVCDAFKERKSLLMDFNNAQVTVVHVPCISKNAADDKLRQCMRRFIDNAGSPCAVMLISSDVNFSVDLSDFKNRKKIHVILVHGPLASEALILSSNEHYLFDDLVDHVSATPQIKAAAKTSVYLDVTNLPSNASETALRQRLEQIAENCGGKVSELHRTRAIIRFTSSSAAERALLRMNGEDVFGRKIAVQKIGERNFSKFGDATRLNFPPPPNMAKVAPPTLLAFPNKPEATTPINSDHQRPFNSPSKEPDSRNVSESSEDDHHRRNSSSDEVSPHPESSDFDEENERPEKDANTNKDCDDAFIQNRSRVKTIFSNIPQKSLPFDAFSKLFNLSFKCTITLDDLKRMNDIVLVIENGRGPFLLFIKALNKQTRKQMSSVPVVKQTRPRCLLHDKGASDEQELPVVNSALSELSLNVVKLLQSHGGIIPLVSLPQCYASEFGALEVDSKNGVPLEQLLAFVKQVIIVPVYPFKYVQLKPKDYEEKDPKSAWNPLLVTQMNLLGNEIVEMLKAAPSNRVPFNNFIAAYFDHFKRHCKVSDYGYARLVDLLEAMPHSVQVLGEGSTRYLTLSHQILINRFRSDVVKMLKQFNKRVALKLFEEYFEKANGKKFKPQDYGLCESEDLLNCLIESKSIEKVDVDGEEHICLPKKELTEEQLVKVKQFSVEAYNLLKASPKYAMEFSKFIPAYHVQYGKQCRLANYGCSKLVELFELIRIVEVKDIENSTEKLVRLNLALRLETLGTQLIDLIKSRSDQLSVLVDSLPDVFRMKFGFCLDPRDFGCDNIYQVMAKLKHFVQVVNTDLGDELRLSSRISAPTEKARVLNILCSKDGRSMNFDALLNEYKSRYSNDCQLDFSNTDAIKDLFVVEGNEEKLIKLSPSGELAWLLLNLITEKGGRVPLNELENAFSERFGCRLSPADFGHDSLTSMLSSLSLIVTVRGKGAKKVIHVNDVLKTVAVNNGKQVKKQEESSSDSAKSKEDAPEKQLKSRIAAVFPTAGCRV